jgi:hypothetical protein
MSGHARRRGVRDHQLPPGITEYHLKSIPARPLAHDPQRPRSSVYNGPVRHRAQSGRSAQPRDDGLKLVDDFRHGSPPSPLCAHRENPVYPKNPSEG